MRQNQNQLGWIVDAAIIVSSLATAGMQAYSTVEMLDLAKEQAELNEEIQEKKLALEQELVQAQLRISEIQAQGLEVINEIELDVAKFEAESIKANIKRLEEIAILQQKLDKIQLQREIDKQNTLSTIQKQEEKKILSDQSSTKDQSSDSGNFFPILALSFIGVGIGVGVAKKKKKEIPEKTIEVLV